MEENSVENPLPSRNFGHLAGQMWDDYPIKDQLEGVGKAKLKKLQDKAYNMVMKAIIKRIINKDRETGGVYYHIDITDEEWTNFKTETQRAAVTGEIQAVRLAEENHFISPDGYPVVQIFQRVYKGFLVGTRPELWEHPYWVPSANPEAQAVWEKQGKKRTLRNLFSKKTLRLEE